MTRPLKTVVIGTGKLSTKRIYPYLPSAGMTLTACAARHLDHAEEKCALYGGRPYTNWKDMIEQENPEAVIACVGPELHYEAAGFCIKRGIPVYTEKPPAPSAAHVEALLAAAREQKSLCMTGFKKRYSASYIKAKEWLQQFPASRWQCFSVDWYAGKFDLELLPPETVLLDFGIHALDLVTWLFGPAEKVAALRRGWDSFAVTVKMESGVIGTLTFSDHRSFEFPGEETEITVAGGNAMTIHNSSSWRMLQDGRPAQWYEPPTCLAGGDSGYNTGMLRELEVFAEQVRSGATSTDNLETSLSALRLYDAVKASVESDGAWVGVTSAR